MFYVPLPAGIATKVEHKCRGNYKLLKLMAKSFYIKNVFVPVSKPMYALLEEKGLSP